MRNIEFMTLHKGARTTSKRLPDWSYSLYQFFHAVSVALIISHSVHLHILLALSLHQYASSVHRFYFQRVADVDPLTETGLPFVYLIRDPCSRAVCSFHQFLSYGAKNERMVGYNWKTVCRGERATSKAQHTVR